MGESGRMAYGRRPLRPHARRRDRDCRGRDGRGRDREAPDARSEGDGAGPPHVDGLARVRRDGQAHPQRGGRDGRRDQAVSAQRGSDPGDSEERSGDGQAAMRRIAVVSVGRSDWGHLAPVIEALGEGAFPVGYNGLGYKDDPHSVSQRMGDAVQMYADLWDGEHPDLVLLFGDRYEQLAAAMASLPFSIPLAHLHGGETTVGAFDNQIRHALTKMAHLHLVSHRRHGARVRRMGEDRWRIHVTGAPGLDRLRGVSGMRRVRPIVLLTLHPCTLEYEDTELVVDATLAALDSISGDHDFMVTAPNADTFGGVIAKQLRDWIAVTPGAQWVEPTDEEYVFLMASAAVMVGKIG